MANKPFNEKKTAMRMRRRSRRRIAASIVLLIAVSIVGGSLLAVVIHLETQGRLHDIFTIIKTFFTTAQDIDGSIIVFWLLAIPVLLLLFLLVNTLRRRKLKYYRMTWEDIFRIAVEREKEAYRAEREKLEHVRRFSSLYDVSPVIVPTDRKTGYSLQELCEKFRMFAANNLRLYYTEAQVREFISSLAVSRILILQGISGTGKTSLTYAFGEFIGNSATIIPVQPMWKERSDLLGYYNEFTKKYNETTLLRKMYEANGGNALYITVLDEMNIARVEYYFAEFLSLLEIPDPELRYLEVVSDVWQDDPAQFKNGRIKLPENMWFIGTVNNDDSTFAISDKVYDRAMIINLDSRTMPFGTNSREETVPISIGEFTELTQRAQMGYEITKRNERRLKELDDYLISKFQITFGNRIMRQIRNYISVYVSCGGDELEALDDILCKKVLRKLLYKDLSVLRKDLRDTSKYLETLFGPGKMPVCRDYLERVTRL